jgi:hypothetical protein
MAGLGATIAYTIIYDPEKWSHTVTNTVNRLKDEPYMPVFILGGFFLGVIARVIFGGGNNQSPVYQDIIAWVSLIAMVGIIVQVLIVFVINPSLSEETGTIELPALEGVLAGTIAFYFAARS